MRLAALQYVIVYILCASPFVILLMCEWMLGQNWLGSALAIMWNTVLLVFGLRASWRMHRERDDPQKHLGEGI